MMDWLTADRVTAGATLLGVIVAWWQLGRIAGQLRNDQLMAVLEIESQLNDRKAKLDEINLAIGDMAKHGVADVDQHSGITMPDPDATKRALEYLAKQRLAALENYHNCLDRLCFCILKEFLPEKEWKLEYRDYLFKAIETNPADFTLPKTKFRNALKIHEKWKES